MNVESALESAGVPVKLGLMLIQRLGIDTNTFRSTIQYNKFRDILQYLKDKDASVVDFVVSNGTRRTGDVLENMFYYVGALKKKEQSESTITAHQKVIEDMTKVGHPDVALKTAELEKEQKHLELIKQDIDTITR